MDRSQKADSVAQLNATLRSRGWTPVPASEAKPGDVVIIQGGGVSHTEIVSGPGGQQILVEDPFGNVVELFQHA